MAASAYSVASQDERIASINITPLVDVMLVLLVIFMIAAPTVSGTLDMRLPGATGKAPPAPPERMQLAVDASGGFALDGQPVTRHELGERLVAAAKRDPEAIVEIAASRDADYQAFATALSTTRGSGIGNVTFQR